MVVIVGFLFICVLLALILMAVIINRLSEVIKVLRERLPVQSQVQRRTEEVQGSQMRVVVGGEPGKGGII